MLGIHVGKERGGKKVPMSESLQASIEKIRTYVTRPCAQIFVSGPRSYSETLTHDDKTAIRKYIDANDIPLVIHGAYIDYPWTKSLQSIRNVMSEMQVARQIGATGVIVHLGAGALNDDNFQFALDTIGTLPSDVCDNVTLWLEINTAKSSPATYETVGKISRLFERVEQFNNNLTIGLCIDTAHLFSCGKSLDTDQAARAWIEGLPDVPTMMHLNDSASELGSGVDKHASLCSGGIWRDYHPVTGSLPIENSGLVYLLGWAESNNIMTILERHDDASDDLALIHQLGFFQ